ncbi:unnamed protein product [Gadus morhua 'NCC']
MGPGPCAAAAAAAATGPVPLCWIGGAVSCWDPGPGAAPGWPASCLGPDQTANIFPSRVSNMGPECGASVRRSPLTCGWWKHLSWRLRLLFLPLWSERQVKVCCLPAW